MYLNLAPMSIDLYFFSFYIELYQTALSSTIGLLSLDLLVMKFEDFINYTKIRLRCVARKE